MKARLVHIESGQTVSTTPVRDGTLVIGRDASADLVLPYGGISRHHATLERVEEGHALRDLGSTNGTRVNGTLLGGAMLLRPGDVIKIGDEVALVYEREEDAPVSVREEPEIPPRPRSPLRFAALALSLAALACLAVGWWLRLSP